MNIKEKIKVLTFLNKQCPSVDIVEDAADLLFGPIKWSSQMGYGDGVIICEFPEYNIKGYSHKCVAEEALLDALSKLIKDKK